MSVSANLRPKLWIVDLLQNSKRDTVTSWLDLGFSAVLLAQSTTMTWI